MLYHLVLVIVLAIEGLNIIMMFRNLQLIHYFLCIIIMKYLVNHYNQQMQKINLACFQDLVCGAMMGND